MPALSFLMIDGRGAPNSAPAYRVAIQALYALSHTLKFAIKKERGVDYRVGPLEHATQLIRDGQRIRVHGTAGYVEIVP